MKKILALVMAAALAVLAPLSAMADTTVSEPVVLAGSSASLPRYGGTYYMNRTVYDLQGNVIAGPFGSLNSRRDGLYYEVANENVLNNAGVIDNTGAQVLPMAYGDIIFVDDNWIFGVVLEATTDVNGDYKDGSGNQYNIARVDVVYDKQIIGTLGRMEFQSASYGVKGGYLYLRGSAGNGIWLSTSFERVEVSADDFVATEFTYQSKKGIFHNPTQTYAFTAGCTLQPEDVDQQIWYTDDGDFVDLQGNVVSQGTVAGVKEYDAVYYYGGDHMVVRTSSGKRGLVNMQGEEIVAPQYKDLAGGYYDVYFAMGYQAVLTDEGSLVYLDEQGNVLVQVDYNLTDSDYKGYAYNAPMIAVKNMGKYIIITATQGQLEETYDDITVIRSATQRLMAVKQGDLWGVIDIDGNLVIPFCFRSSPDINSDGTAVIGTTQDRQCVLYNVSYGDIATTVVADDVVTDAWVNAVEDAAADKEADKKPADASGNGSDAAKLADGEWACTNCNTVNSGKFCTECGTAKPVEEVHTVCSNCGYEPEDGTTPKFCPECGTKFE